MDGTNHFKRVIWNYLLSRAEEDDAFQLKLDKEGKSLDECVVYILNEVSKSGKCGFSDEEIYSMAMHYYDEDIEVGELRAKPKKIVVNETIELSEQEKEELRKVARKRYEEMLIQELRQKGQKASKKKEDKSLDVEQLMFVEDETQD